MIDPKSLQLGNIVRHKLDEVEIYSILTSVVNIIDKNGITKIVDYENIHPIKLTPEILERCGFVKHNADNYWIGISNFNLQKLIVTFIEDEIIISFSDEYSTEQVLHPLIGVKYTTLHTLQNLLTVLGHKLEVK